jgi:hypothetical protein
MPSAPRTVVEKSPANPKSNDLPRLKLVWYAILIGTSLYALNHIGVLSGAIHTPRGYVALYTYQDFDMTQYLAWIEQAKHGMIIPDIHAAWLTGKCQFIPFMYGIHLVSALLHISSIAAFNAVDFVLYPIAAMGLVLCATTFLSPGRERKLFILIVMCAVPLRLYLTLPSLIYPALRHNIATGLYIAWISGDGLLLEAPSPTLTFGTATVLFAAWALGRYALTSEEKYLWYCSFISGASAFLHPFEIFLIAPATAIVVLYVQRADLRKGGLQLLRYAILPGLAISPYVILTLQNQTAADLARRNSGQHPYTPLYGLQLFGIAVPIALLSFYKMREHFRASDIVLQALLVLPTILLFTPRVPFPFHAFDGSLYIASLLATRQFTRLRLLSPLWKDRIVAAALAACLVLAIPGWIMIYRQIYIDGKSECPDPYHNSFIPADYFRLIDWFRAHASKDELVLSPQEVAFWLATVPMHSFASHPVMSLRFNQQKEVVKRLFEGKTDRNFLHRVIAHYGIRYIVVPDGSPLLAHLSDAKRDSHVGRYTVFEIAGSRMKPYSRDVVEISANQN